MKKLALFFRYVVLLSVGVLFSAEVFAAIDPVVDRWQGFVVTTSPSSTHTIQDNQWPQSNSNKFANAHCQNVVGLHFDPNVNQYISDTTSVYIKLEITYKDASNTVTTVRTVNLQINYDPYDKTSYKAKHYYPFEDGYHVSIEVITIMVDGSIVNALPSYAYLEASIAVERYWSFKRNTPTTITAVTPATMNTQAGEIEVHWAALDSAEEYDLEWIYIDDYDTTSGNFLAASALEYDFSRKATRVTLTSDFYRLSHLFGHGYVLFRVRPIGRDIIDPAQRQLGKWSLWGQGKVDTVSSGKCFISVAHRDSLNWQAQLSFIEAGKKKEVISYHDGSLRGRQTVSRIDADSNAIVSEAYYDFEGRSAVQALPTPIPQRVINYYPSFNLSQQNTGQAFSWQDFDLDTSLTSGCSVTTNSMDTTKGTARYYSSENPDKEAQQAYVPRAFGYPFSRVEYMPDPTGRVRRQGGVGATYRLDSGHETKYFYGEPYQEELNRLFGTEAGYAMRYKQNMVVDPNGQVSVAYLDAHGRTIATALAGDEPINVDQLTHNLGDSLFSVDLMAFNDSMLGGGWRVQKEHLVKSDGYHYFDYSLEGASFQDSCLLACYDCVYNLSIKVIDECKEVMLSLDTTIQPLSLIDTLCDTAGVVFSILDSVYLYVGSYQVIKELTINQAALDYYTDQYLAQATCLKTEDDFIQAALDSMDFSGCSNDYCEWKCVFQLGTRIEYFAAHPEKDPTDYVADSLACVQACQGGGQDCAGVLSFLGGDMRPGGQYALYEVTNGQYSAANYPYSIFDTTGIDSLQYFVTLTGWSSPYNYTNPNLVYTNNLGSPDTIGGLLPNQLSIRDFILNFKPSWGDTLAKYLHPDNCLYYNCLMLQASYAFDDSITSINDYAGAVAAGYLVNDTLNLPYIDPYFSGPGSSQLNDMIAAIWYTTYQGTNTSQQTIHLNMHQVAVLSVYCPHLDSTASDSTIRACADTTNLFSDSCLNTQLWLVLRGLYLGEKHRMIDSLLNQNACATHNIPGKRHYYVNLDSLTGVNPNQVADSIVQQGLQQGLSGIQNHCDSTCSGYVNYWWGQLDSCRYLPKYHTTGVFNTTLWQSDSTAITALLLQICKTGCDGSHPLGASSLPPGISIPGTNHTNFVAVIDSVFSDPATLIISSNPKDSLFLPGCNALLISMPPPYGHSLSGSNSTFPTMDTCSCNVLLKNRDKFLQLQASSSLPQGVVSQGDLLAYDYGITVIDPDGKVCACEDAYVQDSTSSWSLSSVWGQGAVSYLDSIAIPIDAGISCPNCVSCSELQAIVDSLPVGLDTIQGGHFLFANILNQELGYNLSYWDYKDFLDSCNVFSQSICSDTAYVNELGSFLNHMVGRDSLLLQDIDISGIPSDLYTGDCGPTYSSGLVYNWKPGSYFSSYYMLQDSGQALVGAGDDNGGSKFRFGRLDKHHRWVFIKTFENADSVYFLPQHLSVYETPDKNLLVYGLIKLSPTPLITDTTVGDGIGMIMFDSLGNVVWEKTYLLRSKEINKGVQMLGIGGLEVYETATHDRYALLYEVDEPFRGSRSSFIRIFSFWGNGTPIWENDYPDLKRSPQGFYDEVQRHEEGFTFPAFNSHLHIFGLFRVDTVGIKIWGNHYAKFRFLPYSYGMDTIPGGYRLVIEQNHGDRAPVVIEVESDSFQVNWMKQYTSQGNLNFNNALSFGNYDIETVNDNGFALAGKSFDLEGSQVYFLAKFDSLGNLIWADSLTDFNTTAEEYWLRIEERIADQYSILRSDTTEVLYHYLHPHRLCGQAPLSIQENVITTSEFIFSPSWTAGGRDSSEWSPTFGNIPTLKDPECGEKLIFSYQDTCGASCEIILQIDSSGIVANVDSTPGPSFTNITHFFNPQAYSNGTFSFHARYVHNGNVDTVLVSGTSTCYDPCQEPVLCDEPLFANIVDTTDCRAYLTSLAHHYGAINYQEYIDSIRNAFRYRYSQHCLKQVDESFDLEFNNNEYHYTLYYYDQAGSLTKTVPPHGVDFLDASQFTTVNTSRNSNGTALTPSHTLVTKYEYNSLGELVAKHTPDDGLSEMWYDRLGRVVVSQNSKQATNDHYGYILYDELGRVTEGGQTYDTQAMTVATAKDSAALNSWLQGNTSDRHERTITHYDYAINSTIDQLFEEGQAWLRGRVATIEYRDESDTSYRHSTHYSYDVRGNAKEVISEFPDLAVFGENYKRMTYDYDLLSGNVNRVTYQPDASDQLIHTYSYDADNRLHEVYSSRDGYHYDKEAKYFYYQHGPLARIEVGHQQVQGIDYAYTLQGWLKGVNSNTLQFFRDIGKDGDVDNSYISSVDSLHFRFGRDAFGFSLGYFDNVSDAHDDFRPIQSMGFTDYFIASEFNDQNSQLSNLRSLYNGNINHMVTAMMDTAQNIAPVQATLYHYDQLHRITGLWAYQDQNVVTNNSWGNPVDNGDYHSNFSFDEAGNLLKLNRRGHIASGNQKMDSLTYHYYAGTNRLEYVDDDINAGNYAEDVDDQSSGNYQYDEIGNLTSDNAEEIGLIIWDSRNKIRHIIRGDLSPKPDLEFRYDAGGNRILKIVKPDGTNQEDWTFTYYMRDPSGNPMAVYERSYADANDMPSSYDPMGASNVALFKEQEYMLYGSSRLGMMLASDSLKARPFNINGYQDNGFFDEPDFLDTATTIVPLDTLKHLIRGRKRYELSNHLGNVLATVSDRKLQLQSTGSLTGYTADVWAAQDYYAFGMTMTGRSWQMNDSYRYSFNGKETDEETGLQDYGFRIYNPAIAKFLSVDPLAPKYPWYTPYQFAGNQPIWAIDLDGLEDFIVTMHYYTGIGDPVEPEITYLTDFDVENDMDAKVHGMLIKKVYHIPRSDGGDHWLEAGDEVFLPTQKAVWAYKGSLREDFGGDKITIDYEKIAFEKSSLDFSINIPPKGGYMFVKSGFASSSLNFPTVKGANVDVIDITDLLAGLYASKTFQRPKVDPQKMKTFSGVMEQYMAVLSYTSGLQDHSFALRDLVDNYLYEKDNFPQNEVIDIRIQNSYSNYRTLHLESNGVSSGGPVYDFSRDTVLKKRDGSEEVRKGETQVMNPITKKPIKEK